MAPAQAVTDPILPDLNLVARGKVRDLYEISGVELLFIATDRISAFDIILANGIPGKGALLTSISLFWFDWLSSQIPGLRTHLISPGLPGRISQKLSAGADADLSRRSMLVRRMKVFPLESIVRGYITGSAWKEYQKSGTVHGMEMSKGMQESERFPDGAIWTPSTKAEMRDKDENIHPDQAAALVGEVQAKKIEQLSLQLYRAAHDYARSRGIIIADTKFEFGYDPKMPDEVVLVDEVITPDSSRFWPLDQYEVGKSQSSFDKQFMRDWLVREGLKGKTGVVMPEEVVKGTSDRYEEAARMLTGVTTA